MKLIKKLVYRYRPLTYYSNTHLSINNFEETIAAAGSRKAEEKEESERKHSKTYSNVTSKPVHPIRIITCSHPHVPFSKLVCVDRICIFERIKEEVQPLAEKEGRKEGRERGRRGQRNADGARVDEQIPHQKFSITRVTFHLGLLVSCD